MKSAERFGGLMKSRTKSGKGQMHFSAGAHADFQADGTKAKGGGTGGKGKGDGGLVQNTIGMLTGS
jgi:hypothetical protein